MSVNYTPEQKRAIEQNGNILISASAGSGKTTVLVERVLNNIINKKVPINRMLVLTFTELASSEMKAKITSKLIEVAKEGGEVGALMREQIALMPFSQISTIHSFCLELARSHFDYLGIDPVFDILSEMEVELYKRKAFESAIEKVSTDKNSVIDLTLLVNVLTKNRTYDEFYAIVKKIYENAKTQVDEHFLTKQVGFMFCKDGISFLGRIIVKEIEKDIMLVNAILDSIRKEVTDNVDVVEEMVEKLQPFRKGNSLEEFIRYAVDFKLTKRLRKSNTKDSEYVIEMISKARGVLNDAVKKLREMSPYSNTIREYRQTEPVLTSLVKFTEEFAKEYGALKAKDGKQDFNDLETYALEILKNDELVEEIKGRFDAVFVDEYQDTNPVQEYIIDKVAKDERFYVGDLKQSIYGFRLCDPRIIKNRYDNYKKTGEGTVIDLNCNFRSSEGIIDFVNRIFDRIMTEATSMVDYKGTSRLNRPGTVMEKLEKNDDCKIVLIERPKKNEKEKISGVYNPLEQEIVSEESSEITEAKYILNEIIKLVGSYEINGQKCKYSDIAILARSRSSVGPILEYLAKYVPLNIIDFDEKKSLEDIKLLSDVLSLALNTKQDKPLATVLLSFFGKLTEQELAVVRTKYSSGDLYGAIKSYADLENDQIATKIRKLLSLIENIRFTSSFKSVPTLLRNLLSEGYDEYILSLEDGEARLSNLNDFILDLQNNKNLNDVVDYLDYVKTSEIKPKTISSKNKDAVQVMTIHKSKGLEFPIVFLPELNLAFNNKDAQGEFLYNSDVGMGIYYYDHKTYLKRNSLGRRAVGLYIEHKSFMESIRLFYVALTRAKNKMYLLGQMRPSGYYPFLVEQANSYLDMLLYVIERDEVMANMVEYLSYDGEIEQIEDRSKIFGKPDERLVDMVKSAVCFKYPYKTSTTMPFVHSATSINSTVESSADAYKITEESAYVKTGVIYHKVMEHIDFSITSYEDVVKELDKMVEASVLLREERDVVDASAITKVLNLDIIRYASRYNCFREKEFVIKIGANKVGYDSTDEVVVQGVMDLVIQGDKTILVDYKFSSRSDDELREAYEKQFYVYETAYKTLFNAEIDKKIIVNLKRGTEIPL